jgi:hypothetical protein
MGIPYPHKTAGEPADNTSISRETLRRKKCYFAERSQQVVGNNQNRPRPNPREPGKAGLFTYERRKLLKTNDEPKSTTNLRTRRTERAGMFLLFLHSLIQRRKNFIQRKLKPRLRCGQHFRGFPLAFPRIRPAFSSPRIGDPHMPHPKRKIIVDFCFDPAGAILWGENLNTKERRFTENSPLKFVRDHRDIRDAVPPGTHLNTQCGKTWRQY